MKLLRKGGTTLPAFMEGIRDKFLLLLEAEDVKTNFHENELKFIHKIFYFRTDSQEVYIFCSCTYKTSLSMNQN